MAFNSPASVPMQTSLKPSMAKTFGLVATLTALSKIIGLIRDMIVASAFGATSLADAYNFACNFTANILVIFGGLGGPFHSASVTILQGRVKSESAGRLALQMYLLSSLFMGFLSFLLFTFAGPCVHLFVHSSGIVAAPLLSSHADFEHEAVSQLRIMSPLLLISALVGISYGISNVRHKYFLPSISPAFVSVAIIGALLLVRDKSSAVPLAVATLTGGSWQFLAQLPDISRTRWKFSFALKPAEGLNDFMRVLCPAIVATSIGNLMVLVDSYFCFRMPHHEGVITAWQNANRILQLPLGVLITAIMVPILPRFSEYAIAHEPEKVKWEFRRAVRFLWFVSLPIAFLLILMPVPIIRLLYERGAWSGSATALLVSALTMLAPSIGSYIGRDLITRVFFAYRDTTTPYYVGLVAIVLKITFDWLFIVHFNLGIAGMALATSLITVINFMSLIFLLKRKIGNLGMTGLRNPVLVMLLASLISVLCASRIFQALQPAITNLAHLAVKFVEGFSLFARPGGVGIAQIFRSIHFEQMVALFGGLVASSACAFLLYFSLCIWAHLDEALILLKRFSAHRT